MTLYRDILSVYQRREVLINLVQADMKLRYRRSVLGYAWSLLHPVLTLAIMTLVFAKAMNKPPRDYALYVFSGLLPWNFLVSGLWGAGISLITNEELLKKIYLPKLIFPISVTLARFADFIFNLMALFIIVSFISFHPSWALLLLPAAALLLFLFISAVAVAVSVINVYIRDTTHLISVLTQLGFYLTPILYPEKDVPEPFRFILILNPMTHIVRLFQSILSEGVVPDAAQWCIAILVTVTTMVFGYFIFARLERKLIFRL